MERKVIRVEVTADDIQRGEKKSETSCAIAVAAKRSGAKLVYVDPTSIHVDGVDYRLPDEARRFVDAFDACHVVEPFSFEAKEIGFHD